MKPKERGCLELKWIWKVSGQEKKWIFLLILINALQGMEGTLFALELRKVIDYVVNRQINSFLFRLTVMGILVLSAIALNATGQWWMAKSKTLIEKRYASMYFLNLCCALIRKCQRFIR